MVLISLVSVLNLLNFYISTFRSMCAVLNMAVLCSSLTSCFPGMLLVYFLNNFEIVPVALIITGINFIIIINNIVWGIKSRRMRWAGHVARMGEERWMYRVFVGKPEGKRPLGRPRRRWVNNIRMDHQQVGCEYMDWIGLAQDRDRWRTLVSAVMNLRVP